MRFTLPPFKSSIDLSHLTNPQLKVLHTLFNELQDVAEVKKYLKIAVLLKLINEQQANDISLLNTNWFLAQILKEKDKREFTTT